MANTVRNAELVAAGEGLGGSPRSGSDCERRPHGGWNSRQLDRRISAHPQVHGRWSTSRAVDPAVPPGYSPWDRDSEVNWHAIQTGSARSSEFARLLERSSDDSRGGQVGRSLMLGGWRGLRRLSITKLTGGPQQTVTLTCPSHANRGSTATERSECTIPLSHGSKPRFNWRLPVPMPTLGSRGISRSPAKRVHPIHRPAFFGMSGPRGGSVRLHRILGHGGGQVGVS